MALTTTARDRRTLGQPRDRIVRRALVAVTCLVSAVALAAPRASADAAESSAKPGKDGKPPRPAKAPKDAAAPEPSPSWLHYELPESGYPNGWLVASQGSSPNHWSAATIDGVSTLNLFTEDATGGGACASASACSASQCVAGYCRQRVKQKSPRLDFTFGKYQWRVYVPMPKPVDAQFSVGAFLYADDAHELDFECGAGKKSVRESATLARIDGSVGPARSGEIVCYLVSQGNPSASRPVAVPANVWHTLEIELTADTSSRYVATWRIDGVDLQSRALTFGPADDCAMYVAGRKCTWQAFVSTENLAFIGDTYPTTRNDAYFDWVRYAAVP